MKMTKTIGGIVGIAAALALNVQAQNLLVNGDFENAGGFTANPIGVPTGTGISGGWACFSANTLQSNMHASPSSPESGTYALLSDQTAVPPNWGWAGEGAYQIVPITPVAGNNVNYTVWTLTDNGVSQGMAQSGMSFNFYDAAGVNLGGGGSQWMGWVAPLADGVWYQMSATAQAPANAAYVCVYAMQASYTGGNDLLVYFDNAVLEVTPEPSTMALLGMGLAIPFYFIRRKS
jgi:hypothetical protein